MSRSIRFVSSAEPELVQSAVSSALFDGGEAVCVLAPDRPQQLNGPLPDSAAVVIETSGSTGSPKQVWFEKEALIASAELTSTAIGPAGTWWLVLPLHYIAGLQVVLRSRVSRSDLVIAPHGGGIVRQVQESLPRLLVAKEQGQPVYSSMVPAQLHTLWEAVDTGVVRLDDLAVFDRVLVGGGRIPGELLSRVADLGLPVTRTYGMAETSGGCVWDGAPLDGVQIREQDGHVALSGPMLAGGYVGEDELTHQAFVERDGQRWFISQDLGTISDGRLTVSGRADDVISSGGVKLNLSEVENFLQDAGLVPDAVVVGVPDVKWGEVPAVFGTSNVNFEGVKDQLIDQFGAHSSPALFIQLTEMPRLSSGKPDRQALRERAITEREHNASK